MLDLYDAGARISKAAETIGISTRQLQRWKKFPDTPDGRIGSTRKSPHALTNEEKQQIINIANSPEFCDLSPKRMIGEYMLYKKVVFNEYYVQ